MAGFLGILMVKENQEVKGTGPKLNMVQYNITLSDTL